MRRAPLPLLILLAGAGLALALLLPDALDGPAPDVVERASQTTASTRPIEAPAAAATPPRPTPPPALPGRARGSETGPVRVLVRAPDGTPLPDVTVEFRRAAAAPEEPVRVADTDEAGVAHLGDMVRDGRFVVVGLGGWPEAEALAPEDARWPLDAPTVVIEAPWVLPVDVELRDAVTGHLVDGAETAITALPPDDVLVGSRRVGVGLHRHWRRAPPGGHAHGDLHVRPPEGHAVWDELHWSGRISAYATRLRQVVPLRRTGKVVVSLLDHEGRVAEEPLGLAASLAGRPVSVRDRTRDGWGNVVLPSVPWLAGETLEVEAWIPGTTAHAAAQVRLPARPEAGASLELRLPPPRPGTSRPAIGVGGGGAGRGYRSVSFRRREGPTGSVGVQVWRHDGRPAVGADVRVGPRHARTDAEGRALVEDLVAGRWSLAVRQVGLLTIEGDVEVRAGTTVEVELWEPTGLRRHVEVVDAEGRPLPYARIVVEAAADAPHDADDPIDEQGGVQRVDPFTDHRGRRLLDHLPPTSARLGVRWGARSRTIELDVSRQQADLRIVLPPED